MTMRLKPHFRSKIIKFASPSFYSCYSYPFSDETAVDYRLPKLTNQVAESQADYKAMLEMLHKKPKSKSRVITISSDKLPVTSERGKHLTVRTSVLASSKVQYIDFKNPFECLAIYPI